jgi:serine/threonine-protein kinase HipA
MRSLNVWMNGEFVGEWTETSTRTPLFRYARAWQESPRARALSLSLPLTATREVRGEAVESYFDNLLPDNPDIRRRIRERYALRSAGTFELLEAIGRDCVGAVQLLPSDREPAGWNRIAAEPLNDDDVAAHLRNITTTPAPGHRDTDDFRISIAGAQEKTALLRMGRRWYRPLNSTPTTHILKLPLGVIGNFRGDFSDSVENEWFCATFLRQLGLPVANTSMATFGDQRALVVERFDRRWAGIESGAEDIGGWQPPDGAWIVRLPQEDFCQATGRPPTQRYESDGGPTGDDLLDILANSQEPGDDRRHFVLAQIAFWLLAATDGHAKNFSIAHGAANAFRLTPLYDVLSAWPIIGTGANRLAIQDVRLAMAVRGTRRHYRLEEIQARHWRALTLRVGGHDLWAAAQELVAVSEHAVERVLAATPPGFPERVSSTIAAGVRRQAERFRHALLHDDDTD